MSDRALYDVVQNHIGTGASAITQTQSDGPPRYGERAYGAPLQRSDSMDSHGAFDWHTRPKRLDADESSSSVGETGSLRPGDVYKGKYDSPSATDLPSASNMPYAPQLPSGYNNSGSDLPLHANKSGMFYAEDEDDQMRQLNASASAPLYSNFMPAGAAEKRRAAHRSGGLFPWSNEDVLQKQVENREQGVYRQRHSLVSYALALGLVGVFVAQLVLAKQRTGEAIQTHPQFQPMIGPSTEFLISWGASTNVYSQSQLCTISDLCGLRDSDHPDQSYRFVTAIVRAVTVSAGADSQFVHAGIVHIGFNLLVLLTLCCQIERLIGSIAYVIVFMAGGIGGNLLGGNFGLIGQPSVGASGSIYTCISLELVDLVYNWHYEPGALRRLIVSIIVALIGLALGLLPGIDNFSHIGGFCIGIMGGMVFAPSIHATRRHFLVCTVLRVVGLGLLVAFMVALALNFYRSANPIEACRWCRYLSCLPAFTACRGAGIVTAHSVGGGA